MISKERFDRDGDEFIDAEDGWDPVEEQLDAIEEYERALVVEELVPNRRSLVLSKYRVVLQLVGALLLALNVAIVAIMGSFLVFNLVMHAGQ